MCGAPVAAQEQSAGSQNPGPAAAEKPAQPENKEKPAAPTLEELIAQALKNNPDIRVAEAKLRETEAELNRTQLLVTQKVVTLQKGIEVQKGLVAQAEQIFLTRSRMLGDRSRGSAVSKDEYVDAQQKLAQAKAKLSEIEAELAYLTGKSSAKTGTTSASGTDLDRWFDLQSASRFPARVSVGAGERIPLTFDFARSSVFQPQIFPPTPAVPGSATDKLRKALDTQVEVKFDGAPLHDVLRFLEESTEGISFRILDRNDREKEVNLMLKGQVSVGAVLQALEDSFTDGPGLRFVVRDYGILVTWADKVPPGALRVENLYKANPAPGKGGEPSAPKKEPPATEKPK
jgi:hypothetical protein